MPFIYPLFNQSHEDYKISFSFFKGETWPEVQKWEKQTIQHQNNKLRDYYGLDLTALHSTDAGFYTVDLKSPRAMGTTSFSYFWALFHTHGAQ